MKSVALPPRFHQKVIANEAPGGEAAEVLLVVPTIVEPGEEFALKIAVLDADGYPSVELDGAVQIRGDFASPGKTEVPFETGRPAVASVQGVAVAAEGLFRFEAELGGKVFYSNPVRCVRQPGFRVYWGDPHVHTVLSNCHPDRCRSLNFCYAAARYLSGLDWVAAADHVSNGRCDFSKWKEQHTVCDAYDDPPHFVTLPGYEASLKGGAGGDTNVYFRRAPEMFVDEYEGGNARTLCEKLAETVDPADFFVVPHHTTRTGKHGEISDDIYPGEERMPVIEVHSKWGTSECRGNPNPLHKIHPGPSYAVDLLSRGLKLGFIAGTDSHATMPSGKGNDASHIDRLPGLTAVLAGDLTRDAVFDGIRTRHCYGASLERIWLDASVAGAGMGRTMRWPSSGGPRTIRAAAAARSDISKLEIVRNGATIHEHPVGSWRGELAWDDESDLRDACLASPHLGRFAYYYVRATCSSGAQAWSSPVWLLLER